MSNNDPKYCIDCKHCKAEFISGKLEQGIVTPIATTINYWCYHPIIGLDLVTKQPKKTSCISERGTSGRCGNLGVNFEPKDTEENKDEKA